MEKWLSEIEKKQNIRILFAAEVGSRAWGGATEQSDYDVRFIFLHHELRTYLSLEKAWETIDFQTPFDAQGWDIFKALRLLAKSNPSLLEWLHAPIIYRKKENIAKDLSCYIEESYSLYSLYQHYMHLATRNMKEVCALPLTEKCQKKLIQALRAFLLAKVIIMTKKTPHTVLYSMFQGVFPSEEPLPRLYQQVVVAKQTGELVPMDTVKKCLCLMEEERSFLDKESINLPRGKNIKNQLNRWLWELLQKECTK